MTYDAHYFSLFLKPEDAARGNCCFSHRPIPRQWKKERKQTTRDLGPRRFRPARRTGVTRGYVKAHGWQRRTPPTGSVGRCSVPQLFSLRAQACSFLRRKYAPNSKCAHVKVRNTSATVSDSITSCHCSLFTSSFLLFCPRHIITTPKPRGASDGEAGWKNKVFPASRTSHRHTQAKAALGWAGEFSWCASERPCFT